MSTHPQNDDPSEEQFAREVEYERASIFRAMILETAIEANRAFMAGELVAEPVESERTP